MQHRRITVPTESAPLSRNRLLILAAIVLALSLAASPLVVFKPDYRDYWVPWESRTLHFRPWNAYSLENCNYPPVILYALAVADLFRSLLGIAYKSSLNITLVKLPNIAAHLLGALALYRTFAPRRPRVAAGLVIAWLLSLNLFINTALWGQWDVILSIFLLFALLDLRRGAHLLCGVWLGAALATKVQAIFVLPVIGVYLLSLRDWRPVVRTTAGAAIAIFVVFLPMALAGRLQKSLEVYGGSVGTFKFRTIDAWNVWAIANTVEGQFIGGERNAIMVDTRPLFGLSAHFTHRDVGLILFGSYVVALLITVYRRRSVGDVLVAAPLCGVAMYMLATQMHERYIGPPAALMVLWLLLPLRWRVQFAYWSAMAAVSACFVLVRSNPLGMPKEVHDHFRPSPNGFAFTGLFFGIVNLAMFGWLSWMYFQRSFDDRLLEPLDGEQPTKPSLIAPTQTAA